MKTNKYIILIIAVLALTYGCDDDGGDSKIDLIEAAVPNVVRAENSEAFIDLIELIAGNEVSLSFSVDIAQGSPAKTDVVGVLATAAGPVYTAVLDENAQLPSNYTITTNDLVAAFAELNSPTDLQLGDVLSISTRFTLSNGLVVDIVDADGSSGTATNIQSNTALFNTVISYPVSCPSDIAGNYTVVSSGFSTDGAPVNNPLVNFSYDIVLTDNGGGNYTISDGVAGVYQDWYCAPYGYCFETEGNFTDICGTISGSWVERFGCQIDLTGTVNPDGTLTIQWKNCFGDEVTEAIYTPN
jgi:hypothetical protein